MQHAQVVERRGIVLAHLQRPHEEGLRLRQVVLQQRDAPQARGRRRRLRLPLLRFEIHPARQVPAPVARRPVADPQQRLRVLGIEIRRPPQQRNAPRHVAQCPATGIPGCRPARTPPDSSLDAYSKFATASAVNPSFPVRQPQPVLRLRRKRPVRIPFQRRLQPRPCRPPGRPCRSAASPAWYSFSGVAFPHPASSSIARPNTAQRPQPALVRLHPVSC